MVACLVDRPWTVCSVYSLGIMEKESYYWTAGQQDPSLPLLTASLVQVGGAEQCSVLWVGMQTLSKLGLVEFPMLEKAYKKVIVTVKTSKGHYATRSSSEVTHMCSFMKT